MDTPKRDAPHFTKAELADLLGDYDAPHFTRTELADLLGEYLTPAGLDKVLESSDWWWGTDWRDQGRLVIHTDLFEMIPGRRRLDNLAVPVD